MLLGDVMGIFFGKGQVLNYSAQIVRQNTTRRCVPVDFIRILLEQGWMWCEHYNGRNCT